MGTLKVDAVIPVYSLDNWEIFIVLSVAGYSVHVYWVCVSSCVYVHALDAMSLSSYRLSTLIHVAKHCVMY